MSTDSPLSTLYHLAGTIRHLDAGPMAEAYALTFIAIEDRHVPDDHGECEVCSNGELSWPCTVILEATESAARPVAQLAGVVS